MATATTTSSNPAPTSTNIPTALTKEGASLGIKPYTGLTYQATNYEPICGNLGSFSSSSSASYQLFTTPKNTGDKCISSIASFVDNSTTHNVAIYNPATGQHLPTGRVGAGSETCLCFALSGQGINSDVKGGLCLWSDGDGKALQIGISDPSNTKATGLVGSYSLLINNRSLPSCAESDVSKLKASWSATALAASAAPALATGVTTVGAGGNGTGIVGNGTETGDTGGSKTGAIAGGSGGGALLIIILLLLFCCCGGGDGKKKKYKTSSYDIHDGRWLGVPTRQRV
ncbi:hypothetical protein QBC43DRAFT_357382 [Cladorrhinum sp. PSN259]|nr:hypothetical protein QBC43DRAFT_357382 [Cladorrhinum sp. PSN259]